MTLTNYKYQDNDTFSHAIAEGYKQADDYWGILGGAGQYAMHHKVKTGAIALGTLSVVALTAAYFLSPAYATFVGTSVTKAATLVSPAITAMSAFAVAYPLVASLIVVAAVAALIAAPVYMYMNSSKASQIKGVKEAALDACEKDKDSNPVKDKDGNLKADPNKLSTLMDKVTVILGLNPEKAV